MSARDDDPPGRDAGELGMLDELLADLGDVRNRLAVLERSRALSLALTKIDEADLWLRREIER